MSFSVLFSRVVLATALVATAFALSACGRKGQLDLPPSAATSEQELNAQPNTNMVGDVPVAPKGQSKRIPLDVLID